MLRTNEPQGQQGESRASSVEFEETEKHSEPKIWCLVVHLQDPRGHQEAILEQMMGFNS